MMLWQRQPNRWSCLPTSFAIVMGVHVEEVISHVGHDGSQIIRPDLSEPERRKGFHIQEMIDFAISRNWTVTPIEAIPTSNVIGDPRPLRVYLEEAGLDRLKLLLGANRGVLTGNNLMGRGHAVVWTGSEIYNPANEQREPPENFHIRVFWLLSRAEQLGQTSVAF